MFPSSGGGSLPAIAPEYSLEARPLLHHRKVCGRPSPHALGPSTKAGAELRPEALAVQFDPARDSL